jgi:hypothetical protein
MKDNFGAASDIWQKQMTEGPILSAEEIRKRVSRSRVRVQRRRTICVVTSVVLVLSASGSLLFIDTPAARWLRAIQLLTWIVLLGLGPQLYDERRQLLSLGLAATPAPCLDFYQRELERYRNSLRPIPWLMTILSALGLALATFTPRNRSTVVPLGVLMVVVALAWYLRVRWQTPKIQRELEDLRRIREAP